MSADWIMLIPSVIYSRIVSEFSKDIKTKYKMNDDNFSSVGSSDAPSIFPFVFINLLPAVEQGRDLEGTSINVGLFTFQIDVYDNQTQQRARTVMGEIVRIMKKMRFEITAMPSFDSTNGTHRCTARFRRLVGAGDTL